MTTLDLPAFDARLDAAFSSIQETVAYGRVSGVSGLMASIGGLKDAAPVGARLRLVGRAGTGAVAEVVGFKDGHAQVLAFDGLEGIGLGAVAELDTPSATIRPNMGWLGRVVGPMGNPLDGKGPLPEGPTAYPVRNRPPGAHGRNRVGEKLDMGVRAINAFTTCCKGQRMGIFAGSGVGKSMLLSMLARYAAADVNVIGLIGERGREVQEFIQENLGEDGLAKSVMVVATSDEAPLARRQAGYLTLAVSEYFRDQGMDVLCMMDSVTRFAMAQREIGLAAGEPPATKGYTPSVFAELPRLLERAGPGAGPNAGAITGLFTVLVDGDDHNEPIADAVRGILDGHIVLDRSIAERGRYPAIDILRSVSRTMPACNTSDVTELVKIARRFLADYEQMAEMIRLGAYRPGADVAVDNAIAVNPALETFLSQAPDEREALEASYIALAGAMGIEIVPDDAEAIEQAEAE
ncbi:MAG: flagellar protein export ATPase FliI [Alphaproteobacteria bacterium]